MKRFALLRLKHNANQVIMDTNALTLSDAVKKLNPCIKGVQLDTDGYAKLGDVTLCVAEYFQPFCTV
jgi:hypothetical protein